jgi:hypothetical protein
MQSVQVAAKINGHRSTDGERPPFTNEARSFVRRPRYFAGGGRSVVGRTRPMERAREGLLDTAATLTDAPQA